MDGVETEGEVVVCVSEGRLVLSEANDGLLQAVRRFGASIVFCHGVAGRSDQLMGGASLYSRPRESPLSKESVRERIMNIFAYFIQYKGIIYSQSLVVPRIFRHVTRTT